MRSRSNLSLTAAAAELRPVMAQRVDEVNYYEEFLAEREEIQRLKWIISEKEKHDVGFERALTEWVARHRDAWRNARRLIAGN